MVKEIKRRSALGAIAGGVSVTLAGCSGTSSTDESGDDTDASGGDDAQESAGDTSESEDRGDGPGSDGLLYAFAPDRAAVVDPEAGEIETNLETEMDEELSEADWGDARLTSDESKLFAVDGSNDRVGVFDTEYREFLEWVGVGSGPTHAFNPVEGEIWVHADDEGRLYVLDTEKHEVVERVQTGLEETGHGKLIHHEDLYPMAYATNTNDAAVHAVDLESYEKTETVELGDGGGTHYAYYGPQNERLYVEFFGPKMPVVDVTTNEVVDRIEYNSGLKMSPDGEYLAVLEDDAIQFLDATTAESTHLGTVELEGRGPDDLDYFEQDGTLYGFAANTTSEETSLINVDELSVVTHIQAGSTSQDAKHVHRSGTIGGGYYFTPSDAEGTVPVIDIEDRELVHEVEVAEGVGTVAYVGNGNGAWY